MAESKYSPNLSHSQINTGDEVFDLCCTPCSKKKFNKQASKYCVICKEYFCTGCVENHNSFKVLSGHVLVDPKSTKSSSGRPMSSNQSHGVPTELCKRHHLKVVDMFCGNHDAVGCSACFTLNHKSCDDIHYIPDYVQSSMPEVHTNQISTQLTKAIKTMKELKVQHDRFDGDLDKSKVTCKQEIQKYRKEINQIIDNIEAATMVELDSRHQDTKKKIGDMKKNIQDLQDDMERFKSEIESDQSNDSQKFVISKLSKVILKEGDHVHSELSHEKRSALIFTRNNDIISFLMSIVTLGILGPTIMQDSSSPTPTTGIKQPKQTIYTVIPPVPGDNTNKSNTSKKQQDDVVAMTLQKGELYKIVDKSQYTMKQPDDKKTCTILSSCILDNNDILFVDFNNKKLKLVDGRSHKIRSSLAFKETPGSVCRVSSTDIAVSLNNGTIQFISTHDKLIQKYSLRLNHVCCRIAVNRDKLYVCDMGSLYIYTLKGKHVNSINNDTEGHEIFSCIWDIAVGNDEMVYVVDRNNGVITLNTEGNVVWRYSEKHFGAATAVCTDSYGNVIVCSTENVIQLGPDGHYIGVIASHNNGVKNTRTVSYDRNNKKLIIGALSDEITVFTVQ